MMPPEAPAPASVDWNGPKTFLSLKTTVVASGVVIWLGSIMLTRLMLVLFGTLNARWNVACTSADVIGCPLTGATSWKTASGRSLTVQVMPSGDSIDVPSRFSGTRSSATLGSVAVLKLNSSA